MICPKCQTQNTENAKFCINCGANLEDLTSATPSQASSPTQPVRRSGGKKLLIGIAVFIILAFLVAIGIRALYIQIKERFLQNVPTSTTTRQFPSFPTTAPTPTPAPPVTPIQTVGTEFRGVSAILTEVTRKGGVVTVKFNLKASENPSEMESSTFGETKIGTTCNGVMCYSWAINDRLDDYQDTPYSLASSFLVDEVNQMKYEVLKDASGNYLASDDILEMLKTGQSISLYAQFTAPPETCKTVTINFPKMQPFTGISLE